MTRVALPVLTGAALAVALGACRGGDGSDTVEPPSEESAVWLETFTYGWVLFNHRVSYLYVEAADPPAVAVVGGTSTTGQPRELAPECKAEADSCMEFPAWDDAEVTVGWGEVTTTEASFATATAEAVVPAEGATVTVSAPDPGREGSVSAVLQGLSVDTAHPLDGEEACYRPEYGWHPRRLAVSLQQPRREGGELVVDVDLHFVAGNTDDPDRTCIDEVNERALVPMTASVLFVVGPDATEVPISQEASFPFSGNASQPGEQVPPDPIALGLSADGIRGWASIDWSFNPDRADERGAYLRTLAARIDGDEATGEATNYSPFTQLHDFAYHFDGTVVGIPLSGVTHASASGTLPTGIDDDGRPVIYELDGSTPTE